MNYTKQNEIDHRNIDVSNESHRKFVRELFDDWIEESIQIRDSYQILYVYDRSDLYYEGHQTPVGFSNNYLQDFVQKNYDKLNPTNIIKKDNKGLIYTVDNKIKKMIDQIVGEYTSQKMIIDVKKDDNAANNNIEKAIKKLLVNHDSNNQYWARVIVPYITYCLKYGLSWHKQWYDPRYDTGVGGRVTEEAVYPHDVLYDMGAKDTYLLDTSYRIQVVTMELNDAIEYLAAFGVDPKDVNPDSMDRLTHLANYRYDQTSVGEEGYVNLYFTEWKKSYRDDDTKESTKMRYGASPESLERDRMTRTQDKYRDYYFEALYTSANGLINFKVNRNTYMERGLDKYNLTPLVNQKSELKPSFKSTIEDVSNIQDVINIYSSLILNSASQRQVLRYFVDKNLYDLYGDKKIDGVLHKGLLKTWNETGGGLPVDLSGGRKASDLIAKFEIPELPKEAYTFLQLMTKSFQEQTDSSSALSGDYPDHDIPYKLADFLHKQKKKKLSYIDTNINYSMTEVARKLYALWVSEFDDEMILKNIEMKKGDPKMILINGILTMPEYEQFLIEAEMVNKENKLMLEQLVISDPMFFRKRYMLLREAFDKHAKENEVEFSFPENVNTFVDPQGQLIQNAQLNPMLQYINTRVFINMLSKKDLITINIDFDFDKDDQTLENKITGQELFAAGSLPLENYLELLGGYFADNKEDIMQKLANNNQGLQISQMIEEMGEDFVPVLMNFIDNYKMAMIQQTMNNTGNQNQGQQKQAEGQKQIAGAR